MKLDMTDMARCLNLPVSTVQRWIRQGRLPMARSGGEYTIESADLEKWAAERNLAFTPPGGKPASADQPEAETLRAAMERGGIVRDLAGEDVESVLEAAVRRMDAFDDALQEQLYERLLQREYLTSTGIGKGVAIPHPRTPLGEELPGPMVTTCFLKTPVDFKAVDNRPVFVLFILLCPTPKQHLHLLSRLSFCVREDAFIRFLKSRPDETAFLDKIADFEAVLNRKGI